MGFVKGKVVRVIKNAPLQDPVEYKIMGYNISLRRSEAALIEVKEINRTKVSEKIVFEGMLQGEGLKTSSGENGKTINLALVGNPNCGKTTLFNYASGSHERVGNYGGVTVDAKEAIIKQNDCSLKIVDLPGTYSITEYTPEELFVRTHLTENRPDVVINVIDASNLERNLFLTTQLIDMDIKVVIALNMYDELEARGVKFNYTELGKMIGIPIVPTVAVKGKGIGELMEKVIEVHEGKDPVVRHIHINYGNTIEESITRLQKELKRNKILSSRFSTRYLSIKLLEGDRTTLRQLGEYSNYETVSRCTQNEIHRLEKEYGEVSGTIITDGRYGFISGALHETCEGCSEHKDGNKLDIDFLLTHKIWGFPIFFFFMWLMFQSTFSIG
jgi:ferrous iron transport protein B